MIQYMREHANTGGCKPRRWSRLSDKRLKSIYDKAKAGMDVDVDLKVVWVAPSPEIVEVVMGELSVVDKVKTLLKMGLPQSQIAVVLQIRREVVREEAMLMRRDEIIVGLSEELKAIASDEELTVKERIKSLSERGASNRQIVVLLRTSYSYVWRVLNRMT